MITNALVSLEFPTHCRIVRRLEVDTDPVDPEAAPLYEIVLHAYEDELTLLVPELNVT